MYNGRYSISTVRRGHVDRDGDLAAWLNARGPRVDRVRKYQFCALSK